MPLAKEDNSILDEIDRVRGAHYRLTDEELDFIPSTKLRAGPSMKLRAGNYDIKYRMGRDAMVRQVSEVNEAVTRTAEASVEKEK